ncbi:MAG TPA: plasmid pRiA4b ORF-3 family protein [Verrucomicrobiota bacterium]|nr:plasmid pRiA4b ORF-3 family protein [Verrucomicrobiota bacterium]
MGITDAFCQSRLSVEYAVLCRKLAEKLAAKRPSPLLQGRPATWACGILRTIGWVNFLSDPSQSPHLRLPEIDQALGVAESTGQGKAKAIRRLVKVYRFDHRWILPSQWESNPIIWTLQDSNGFLIDIRQQPVARQRAAFKQGLIPYVPADRAAAAVQAQVSNSSSRRLFQFKIALQGIEPLVWRRIQVLDDTLDRLHEHLQTAMGWTNSHLHEFHIQGRRCGDPELLDNGFEPFEGLDSTRTLMSAILPQDGAPLSFEYHYDFGDSWVHDVLYEGSPQPQQGTVYPQCLEGERACPPEDVGGIGGYAAYLQAMADPAHPHHQEMLDWRGPFNPDAFNPRLTTHVMQEGMPDWRKMD